MRFNTDGKARQGDLYPLADRPPGYSGSLAGILTGEKRPPLKGEFYLSGALPQCYRATNDLTEPFWIIRIVVIEQSYTVRPYDGEGQ